MSGADLLARIGAAAERLRKQRSKRVGDSRLCVRRKTQQMGFYTDVFFGLDREHRAMEVTLSEAGVDVGRPKPEGAQCSEASKGGQKCVRA